MSFNAKPDCFLLLRYKPHCSHCFSPIMKSIDLTQLYPAGNIRRVYSKYYLHAVHPVPNTPGHILALSISAHTPRGTPSHFQSPHTPPGHIHTLSISAYTPGAHSRPHPQHFCTQKNRLSFRLSGFFVSIKKYIFTEGNEKSLLVVVCIYNTT